jgi:hypothetical protein
MMSMFKKQKQIRFIDSLSFLTMPLSTFPKTFGLKELKKGYFPHFFNTVKNANYIGKIPHKKHYGYNSFNKDSRAKFIKWHDDQMAKDVVFNMKEEILAYCISDVDILKRGCTNFRKQFLEYGVDPFQYTTIASTVMALYKAKFMPKDSIAVIKKTHTPQAHSKVAMEWLAYEGNRWVNLIFNTLCLPKERKLLLKRENIENTMLSTNLMGFPRVQIQLMSLMAVIIMGVRNAFHRIH